MNAKEIYERSLEAGRLALEENKPTLVLWAEHSNPLDDSSPVVDSGIMPGLCGFAWVTVYPKRADAVTTKFINALKKLGICSRDINSYAPFRPSTEGGYMYWVDGSTQSVEKKKAFAEAMASVLKHHGIRAYASSRLD
jgi:hypothetical protein